MELSISGAVGSTSEQVKVDVLLIVDKSASMSYKMNEEKNAQKPNRRIDKVASAVNQLTQSIGANTDIDVKYSVVTFARNYQTEVLVDWNQGTATNVNTKISNISPTGGTNYQAGIYVGKQQLNKARTDAQKVVIFLTDGLPTYRGDTTANNNKADDAWVDNKDGLGNGQNDRNGYNQAAAETEISGMNCDMFYAIGVGPDFKEGTSTSTGINNLKGLCENVGVTDKTNNSKWYSATDTTELNKAFTDIATEVNYMLCTNVAVLDTLSNMVDFETAGSVTSLSLIHI